MWVKHHSHRAMYTNLECDHERDVTIGIVAIGIASYPANISISFVV